MPAVERLFWQDPYLVEFHANVTRRLEEQDRPAVVLDQTCFYPTSGGQPHDTGSLNEARVVDVLENDGEIIHVLDRPLHDTAVIGRIDWVRRQDHMQQHAGQHLLSAAFQRLVGAATLSFHLGAEECTIDIDCQSLSAGQIDQVEEYANQIVLANTAITARQYTKNDLETIPLRKPPTVEGMVRVVSIGDIDYSACGGTHPAHAGEIGAIHIDRWESRHGSVRVTFLCGMRALRDYRAKSRICRQLATNASVSVNELPEAIDRLNATNDGLRRQVSGLRAQWLEMQTASLLAEAETRGRYRVVSKILQGVEPAEMRTLAQQICGTPGTIALLAVLEPNPQFCLARSEDIPLNMNSVLKASAGRYGGRGGGQPHLVQGGGLDRESVSSMLQDAQEFILDRKHNVIEGDTTS